MNQPSSRIPVLAALAAAALVAACATSPSKGFEETMHATVQDGMPVGTAMHALQSQGFACASGLGDDRRIDCARHVPNLTQTCGARVRISALPKQDASPRVAVAQPSCSDCYPEDARNFPRSVDHIA